MNGVGAVVRWVSDRLGLAPATAPSRDEHERHESETASRAASEAVRRAYTVVDVWNARVRDSWKPGHRDA